MLQEFKEFIMRGNVMDLAVGVVMGSAFTAIVNALVDHIITPIITALTGNASVDDLFIQVGAAELRYGLFLQAIIDFLIIGAVLFVAIKAMNKVMRKKEEEPEEEPIPVTEQYLKDIRDALVEQNQSTKLDATDDWPTHIE
ncbi:large-conductance mechanosensitive channel protein MscL [Atopococcus tabaci]|uniref:large-conductance mechanosensitive channel protein MscL n=1 Tax=Atopococcus tabaci TaxID=269774 RepID=UPI000417F950|nr:large-conductance mechanosensitive channel protein MscL [Atopococcus tabaci]